MANDGLGDKCKLFEQAEAGRKAMRGLPLLARLDGRAFHTFTRGLERPYDQRMSFCMAETARFLVQETHALIGYTQSDEITLLWFVPSDSTSEYIFDGKYQKIASVLAGMASCQFMKLVANQLPQKASATPHFDCRVWQVPTQSEVIDVFVWREDDAVKNSISMAARALYSDKQLFEKTSSVKQEMLFQKGVNWNDYPAFFKRGAYFARRAVERELSEEELARIPEAHRPAKGTLFTRSQVYELNLPPVRKIGNLAAVLFEGAEPEARV